MSPKPPKLLSFEPLRWEEAVALWRELVADPVSGRNGVNVITVETFLNECHWPWAVEGLQTSNVNVERGCGHKEVMELRFSTAVEELLTLQRTRCGNCQDKVEKRFQEKAANALVRAEEAGLPELVALSPRQVAFALCVRDKAFLRFGKAGDFMTVAKAVQDGTWWIDNRARMAHLKVFSDLARQLEEQPPND